MEFTKSRKSLLIVALCLLFGALVGGGVYIYFKDPFGFKIPKLDKYAETLTWCDNTESSEYLTTTCKGLLLNIQAQENNQSCIDLQIISQAGGIRPFAICEKNTEVEIPSEILNYKKLSPVNIKFSYLKSDILNRYTFSNVSLERVSDEYLQSVVNDDVYELVHIDPNSTTIVNSIDFCPVPSSLPSYITEANRTNYTEYFDTNTMSEKDYDLAALLFNIEDSDISSLFTCLSQKNLGYLKECPYIGVLNSKVIDNLSSTTPNSPRWDKVLDIYEYTKLKQISLLYDNTGLVLPTYQPGSIDKLSVTSSDVLNLFLENLDNNGDMSQEVFCSLYMLVDSAKSNMDTSFIFQEEMETYLENNISAIYSPTCFSIINTVVDKQGRYLKSRYTDIPDTMRIYSRCNNLREYIE